MNALPWKDDHSEKINVRLHLGSGILKICDAGTGTDGQVCSAPFSLSTGNSGEISGVGTSLFMGDTNTIIRAGSLEHDVPLVIWGDNTPFTQDSFGAQIRDITVDCANQPGMSGIKNTSTQENSLLINYSIKNCPANSLHLASVKANNAMIVNGNITMGTSFSSSSIPLLLANATGPRPINGLTIQGNTNGPSIATTTASYSASGNVGTISGISFDKTIFGTANGPNGSPSYILIGGVNGWTGVYPILSTTGCAGNICTGMTIQTYGTPAPASNTGTINLVPTYGIVACSGTTCNSFGGDVSTAIGASLINLQGVHVERTGVALEITGNSAISLEATQFSCTSNEYICVETQNSTSIRNVAFHQLASGGAPYTINDLIAGVTSTDQFKADYITGTPAPTNGGLLQWSVPAVFTERSAPGNGIAGSGKAVLYADSTSHRLTMNNGGAGPVQVVAAGQDIDNTDHVTKINSTSVPVNAAADTLLGTTAPALGSWLALPNCQDASGNHLNYNTTTHAFSCGTSTPSGGMVYPSAGLAVSTGTSWGTSIVAGAAGHFVRSNGASYADSAIQASDIPTLNQNTTGTAANLSGTPLLPNGTTAATQTAGDNSAKLATTAYVDTGLAAKAASNAGLTVNGQPCYLGGNCTIPAPSGLSGGYETLKFVFGSSANINTGDTAQSNPPYRSTTLAGCFAHADTAPAGQAIIVDVQVGGSSVFGVNPKITIAAGANDSPMVTAFSAPAVGPTTPAKATIAQTGTTTPGAGVTVVCGTTDSGVIADPDPTGAANSDARVMTQKALNTALAAKENIANKGAANGYAALDATGKVPSAQLPAFQSQLGFTPENSANKGVANGYASLDATGKVPAGQLPPGSGGAGPSLLTDTGASGTAYAATPAGCAAGDLTDGKTFLFRPAHTSTGGATTFTYCGISKSLVVIGGSNPNVNDIFVSSTSNPRMYEIVYHASPIDKFELMQHLRMSTDTEANIGTDPTLAVNMPQVKAKIDAYAPLASNLGIRFQNARTNGSAWVPADTPLSPGSGRTYMELAAVSGSSLTGTRMVQQTAGYCATPVFQGVSSTSPRQMVFATDNTTTGRYCIVASSTAVTWAGTEEIFDATIDLSTLTNVSYFAGLVDSGQVNSSILSYTSGNYPGAVVGFRFDPNASDSVTWRCVAARNSSTAPMTADAGASWGTLSGNVTQLQLRLDEANGTARWFIGSGGVLNEVCQSGSWGGNLPSGVGLSAFVGEYITGSLGVAPTLGITYLSVEADTVPGVRP